MFEETNQAMEENEMENLPKNLFDDEEAGEVTPPASDEGESGRDSDKAKDTDESGKAGENHAEEPAASGSTLRVRYNGEEKDISLDEARTLAQKGMNYDHVAAERDRNRVAFDFLKERAKSEGITVEQLIEKEREKTENQRLEAKMSEIRARDDDASEDTVKTLARLELDAEKAQKERESARALEEKNKAEREGWNRLFKEHPELSTAEGGERVAKEVFDLIQAGYSPVEAYYTVRNRELEAQNKMMSDASAAKKKSVGSLAGNQNSGEDDFLAGFNFE